MNEDVPLIDVIVEVRFRDLDAYGHVNHADYFTLLETARTRFMMEQFTPERRRETLFLVVRAACEYKRPIELVSSVRVLIRASRMGRSSFYLDYQILGADDTLHAVAQTRMACVDPVTQRPRAIPEWFRQVVAPGHPAPENNR